MIQFDQILLVRHGDYLRMPEQLTDSGIEDAERARDELIRRGVGGGAVLLSSTAPRALQTAAIIGEGLLIDVKPSKRIEIIGNNPDGVASFDDTLEAALIESDADKSGSVLVVLAHQSLIQCATRRTRVDYGDVHPYQPGTWVNPKFNDFEEQYLQTRLAREGLGSS